MTPEKTSDSVLDTMREHEQQNAWLEYLECLGDPPFPVELPSVDAMPGILRELGVPEEDIPPIIDSRADVLRDSDLWWLLERCVVSLVSTMGSVDPPPRFPSPLDVAGMDRYFFVHVFVATLPHTRRYHQERRIPEAVRRATVADLGRNIRVHRKRYGRGGLEVAQWIMLHFRGCIYQLGRLQFERTRMGASIAEAAVAAGEPVSAETLALSVHIPDFMGPMTPDACDRSYDWARTFFAEHFPEERFDYAICSSWLLDPKLRDYLPETSNIIRFQHQFHVLDTGNEADRTILQFVFGSVPERLESLPRRSSLERAIVEHLEQGGHWRFCPGWHALS